LEGEDGQRGKKENEVGKIELVKTKERGIVKSVESLKSKTTHIRLVGPIAVILA
jgi:hypothetical protein